MGAALAKHLGQLGARVVVADRQEAVAEDRRCDPFATCFSARRRWANGASVSVLCQGTARTPIVQGGEHGRMRSSAAALAEVSKMPSARYLRGLPRLIARLPTCRPLLTGSVPKQDASKIVPIAADGVAAGDVLAC